MMACVVVFCALAFPNCRIEEADENLFVSVSHSQERGKHLKPFDFTWLLYEVRSSGVKGFQETVMGCMVIFCALAPYTSKFGI